jgi:HK97 family phage portal protein
VPPLPNTTTSLGGVLLPAGVSAPTGSRQVVRSTNGVRRAPTGSRAPAQGPLVSYQEIYDTQPIVGAVVNKLTRHGARVPLRVLRRVPGGSRRRGEEVEWDHPLVQLLEQPAPRHGRMSLMQWLLFPLLLHGNALLLPWHADPDGPPTELFPLDWKFLAAWRDRGGFVKRWVTTELGEAVNLDVNQVIHLAWWSAAGASGQIGMSPLEQLGVTLRTDDSAQRHTYAQLNGAHPAGAFELPEGVALTDDVIGALRDTLDTWEGVDAAGGVPILAQGAKWNPFQPTAQEAALIEVRHLGQEEVCAVYDTSPTVIGLLRDASQRANVAEINRDFFGNTLAAPLELLAEIINVQLIPRYQPWVDEGLFVKPDPSEFLRGDPLQWAQSLNLRVAGGGLTLNERRDLDGEPRYTDPRADEPLIADNNMHPLSMLGQSLSTTPGQGPGGQEGQDAG